MWPGAFASGFIINRLVRIYRDAWNQQKGISKTEAKRRYITTLIDAMHRYAITTPDARELVSELEFVWDQIKSNQTSSSSSVITQQPIHTTISSSATTTPRRTTLGGLSHTQNASASGLQILPPMSPTEEAAGRFMNFPPVGMGVTTDDEDAVGAAAADIDDDDDDDGDEHYETMDEFDENGLPKVTVINEPAGFINNNNSNKQSASGSLVRSTANPPPPPVEDTKRKHGKNMSSSQYTATKKSATGAAAFSSGTSSPNTQQQQQGNGNHHYNRWKQRVEVALTKMTAEVAALREQLDVARTLNAANVNLSRGRLNWLKRWISWGVWIVVKHLVIDAILLSVLVMWMRKRGDRRFENLVALIGGFIGERLRLRKGDVREVRTFVVA
ncbi:hypothetical protein TWF694_010564 [Orbilia ellipsospora]|uniref:Uncharacterized protein n=1 Tax=Orbilia ellipsospora TaxID=2528407 RepID=A0AAV9XDC2_9PEZI